MAHMLKAFIKNPEKVSYDGKDNDEQILYIVRKSKLTLVPHFFGLLVAVIAPIVILPFVIRFNIANGFLFKDTFITALTVFWYLMSFGYLLMVFVNWYFNVLIISNKKIIDIDVNGLLYKNISEAALRNIEDVTSTVKGTFSTIFNLGEVSIQTAGEKREFEFTMMDNPSQVRDVISDLVSNLKVHGQNN
jgi:uncharacterized membrane protein YdbT with pleckstrin-like domain